MFILTSHCSCSSEPWDKSPIQWSFMVIITPRTLLLTAQPSLLGRSAFSPQVMLCNKHTGKGLGGGVFLIYMSIIINITQKACLAFQGWRNRGYLMQTACCGGAFKIWMNNDRRVKARGQAFSLLRTPGEIRKATMTRQSHKELYF